MNEKIRALAEKYHAGQFRRGPEKLPYIVHPAAVVRTLLEWGEPEDSPAVDMAWGHDLLEDTPVTEAEIRDAAGDRVLAGIKRLTKPKNMDKPRYLLQVAGTGDRDVLLVKLADRICNTRDFVKDGKVKYAAKYLHWADCVFSSVCALPAPDRTAQNAVAARDELAERLKAPTA